MRCPGQDARDWKHDAIFETKCPECGSELEFFKDQTTTRCKNCGKQVINPKMDFGCASYCQYAEQCMGELPPELLAGRDDLLKDRIALKMKMHFRKDFKKIGQATKVARFAGRLAPLEQANPAVVLGAAYLHNIAGGNPLVDKKENLEQEIETLRLSQAILDELRAKKDLADKVQNLLRMLFHPEESEPESLSPEFKCLHDAIRIFALQKRHQEQPFSDALLEKQIKATVLTASGRELATKSILGTRN
ncbi:MAG: phosphohydrolase [Deltaproteobacteria bacterium]|nr:phosphohydrolase [Deltaproteobacteria bacterium]